MEIRSILPFTLILISALLPSSQIFADSRVYGDVDKYKSEILEKLELEDTQYDEVSAILDDKHEAMREIRNRHMSEGKSRENWQKMKAEMDEINESTNQKLAEVLTDEQMQTYIEAEEQKKSEMKSKRNKNRSGWLSNINIFK